MLTRRNFLSRSSLAAAGALAAPRIGLQQGLAADGMFTLSTHKDGDGAIAGLVFASGGPEQPLNRPIYANPAVIQPAGVPRIYRNPDRSGLTFEVKSDEQNHFELKLVRRFMPTS